jgi:diguanylate cyclase (GGDEF)-like protein/PAS domain S-box-containing protein
MNFMAYGDLFQAEIKVIENARGALEQGRIASGSSREEFQWLLDKYSKLFKQTRRLIRFSDRMQNDLNQLNQRLHRSEAKYRNIFENAAQGIFRSDSSGKLLEVNPAMARILGYESPRDVLERENGAGPLETQKGYRDFLEAVQRGCQIRRFQTELYRKNGDVIWVEFNARPFYDLSGKMAYIDGLLSDVTKRKRLQEKLTRLAHQDELTGIFNRRRFTEILQSEIRRAQRQKSHLTLIMMDLDFFKSINDRFGHDAGDKVLKQVTAACRKALRENDVFGRMGGEEFAVILPEVSNAKARQIAERLRRIVENEDIHACSKTIRTTVSIGMCRLGGEISCPERLYKAADTALYRAKDEGRNRVCVHEA